MFSTDFTSLSVLLFSLYQSPSLFLCTVFDSISFNIDEVLSIFGYFNDHRKDWLTYSCGTDRTGELSHNFSISNNGTQMVNFPSRIPNCDSHSPVLLNVFLQTLVFVLQWLSLHWEILIMLLFEFSLTFEQTQNRMPRFIA